MKLNKFAFVLVCIGLIYFAFTRTDPSGLTVNTDEAITPNWAAITAWPNLDIDDVEAQPDPNRRITAIVLDDSGSMGPDMKAAKAAVVGALSAMSEKDRVAVLALNAGVVLPFSDVSEARLALPDLLASIPSDGTTPLTRAIQDAENLLEVEAAAMRTFGTFRLIVTTDGEADDGHALNAAIETLAEKTPIQLTTIGIGIKGRHVLRRGSLGSFVDVANVDKLQAALEAAVAENASFQAITDFGETEG